jgi:hypothetical protein
MRLRSVGYLEFAMMRSNQSSEQRPPGAVK